MRAMSRPRPQTLMESKRRRDQWIGIIGKIHTLHKIGGLELMATKKSAFACLGLPKVVTDQCVQNAKKGDSTLS